MKDTDLMKLSRHVSYIVFVFIYVFAFLLPLSVASQDDIETLELEEVAQFNISEIGGNELLYDYFQISPNNEYIAIHATNSIEVWGIDTQKQVSLIDNDNIVGVFAWSPDSSRIVTVTTEDEMYIWDTFTGEIVDTYEGIDIRSNGIRSIEWIASNTIVTGSFDYLLWDLESQDTPKRFDCHPWGSRLWFSPDKSYIATMGSESTLIWICDSDFNVVSSIEGYRTVEWSSDGSEIATVGILNTLRVWSLSSGEALSTTDGGENSIHIITWHPSLDIIVTGHSNGEVRIWERLTPDIFWLVGTENITDLTDIAWLENQLITLTRQGSIQLWDVN